MLGLYGVHLQLRDSSKDLGEEVATELFTHPSSCAQKADSQLSPGGFTGLLSDPVCLTKVLG